MYTLSVYIAGEIDLFENLYIVHITLLVERCLVHLAAGGLDAALCFL